MSGINVGEHASRADASSSWAQRHHLENGYFIRSLWCGVDRCHGMLWRKVGAKNLHKFNKQHHTAGTNTRTTCINMYEKYTTI